MSTNIISNSSLVKHWKKNENYNNNLRKPKAIEIVFSSTFNNTNSDFLFIFLGVSVCSLLIITQY